MTGAENRRTIVYAFLGPVVGGQLPTFGLTEPSALDTGNVRVPSYLDSIASTVVAGSLGCVLGTVGAVVGHRYVDDRPEESR